MQQKLLWLLFIFLLVLSIFPSGLAQENTSEQKVELHFFYGQGCPHCGAAEPFLDELEQEYPQLEVYMYEVYFNEENRNLFEQLATNCGSEIQGVPTFFIDDEMIVGYSNEIKQQLENEVQTCIESTKGCVDLTEHLTCGTDVEEAEKFTISKMTGQSKVTFPTLIGAAAVDAINPCTIAVLIILLTTIFLAGGKRRILGAGLAFTAAIYISYFLMGLGVYTALQASGIMHAFFYVVIGIALLVGFLSIRSYFKYKPGAWSVEIPSKWRPVMKKLLSSVTSIPGAAVMGFICSLFLLPCSSGPYLVILGLLAKEATRTAAIPLLAFYNFIFVLPMLIITYLVYRGTTSVEKVQAWRDKHIRNLHLISGIIMLALAGLLIASMWFGWV
ncbi:hypothetical protein GF374_02050 [Candidatus Woesearchaeota archaeon]|nr:hypothetical protein [Candidatus Woesearchaeota archaeon]